MSIISYITINIIIISIFVSVRYIYMYIYKYLIVRVHMDMLCSCQELSALDLLIEKSAEELPPEARDRFARPGGDLELIWTLDQMGSAVML